jgi:restriction system protein
MLSVYIARMPKTPKRGGNGAEFVKWFRPLIDCLHELGAAKPREASDWIAEKESVPPSAREVLNKNGGERFINQVCFARQYLLWEGLIDGSKRGIWSLTPRGSQTRLTDEDARAIFLKWVKFWAEARDGAKGKRGDKGAVEPTTEAVELVEADEVKESALLNVLRGLSATGFEHFCRHLLLAYDFEKVTVTKRTRDGGIDGEGILQINPFVSSVVVFQCKRYRHSVSSEEVQNLGGAARGRADKALLITTGTFSGPAKAEAARTTPRIELIDGHQLVAMCEAKQIGLKIATVYDIDHEFFAQFRE